MGKDLAAQKDVNNLIEQLSLRNDNLGIGNKRVKNLKNVSEARGRNQGRVYFREKNGKIEILAKSNKDNQKKVIGILQKIGY
jgi:HD superfamily phosphohydrolase